MTSQIYLFLFRLEIRLLSYDWTRGGGAKKQIYRFLITWVNDQKETEDKQRIKAADGKAKEESVEIPKAIQLSHSSYQNRALELIR